MKYSLEDFAYTCRNVPLNPKSMQALEFVERAKETARKNGQLLLRLAHFNPRPLRSYARPAHSPSQMGARAGGWVHLASNLATPIHAPASASSPRTAGRGGRVREAGDGRGPRSRIIYVERCCVKRSIVMRQMCRDALRRRLDCDAFEGLCICRPAKNETICMTDEIAIPPDRLLDAVDAVLQGLAEMGTLAAGRLPSSLLGSADQPRAFCELTRHEVIAAEAFLIRCGLLTLPDAPPQLPL